MLQRLRGVSPRRLLLGGLGALLGLATILAVIYARPALDYFRFVQTVEGASKRNAAAEGPWPQMSQACVACHGYGGNPANQTYARLAGQPAAYLVRQLTAFADDTRHSPTMSPLALGLSPEDVRRLAAHFAAQSVTPNIGLTADPVRARKGEALVKAGGCATCHGERLAGQGNVPRLAGQGDVYLARQLADFKSGARPDPLNAMKGVVAGLSDDDMQNLAHYIATYPDRAP